MLVFSYVLPKWLISADGQWPLSNWTIWDVSYRSTPRTLWPLKPKFIRNSCMCIYEKKYIYVHLFYYIDPKNHFRTWFLCDCVRNWTHDSYDFSIWIAIRSHHRGGFPPGWTRAGNAAQTVMMACVATLPETSSSLADFFVGWIAIG